MKLSIITPVYNEKETIMKVIEKVKALPIEKEIIVVDDGSTDGTREILKGINISSIPSPILSPQSGEEIPSPQPSPQRGEEIPSPVPSPPRGEGLRVREYNEIKIILKEKNEGKGSAIREGLKYTEGEYVVFQDADLELEPTDIMSMIKAIDDKHQVIYGSRFLKKCSIPLINLLANKFLTLLTNILFKSHITDMETCYKLCPKDLLLSLNLKADGFEIEPEITCKILKKGYKIKEVPVSYNPRIKGKKINWKDGVKAIFYLFKYRFTS